MKKVTPLTFEELVKLPIHRRRSYVSKLVSLPYSCFTTYQDTSICDKSDSRYNKQLRLAKAALRENG